MKCVPWLLGFGLALLATDTPLAGVHKQPAETDGPLADCWQDLLSPDAVRAYRAMWQLAEQPEDAVKFLGRHLEPAPPPDEAKLRQWLAELSSPKFPVREKAFKELEKLGELAEPALQQALATKPDLEMRRRLELLLNNLHNSALRPEKLRQIRAVEILEMLATKEALALLARLGTGFVADRQTREAKESLERLRHRPDFKGWPAVAAKGLVDAEGLPLPAGSRARLGTTRFRHATRPSRPSVSFSPQGDVLVSLDSKGSVYLWEAQTGKLVRRLDIQANRVAVAPRGKLLALGRPETDGEIVLWDWGKQEEVGRLKLPPPRVASEALSFTVDGSLLISSDSDGHLRFWDVKDRKEVKRWQPPTPTVLPTVVAPDGTHVLAGTQGKGEAGTLYVFDLVKEEKRLLATEGLRGLHAAVFCPDGKYLATVSQDETGLRLWEVATGKLWRVLPPRSSGAYFASCAFSPDGKTFAAGGGREGIALWNLKTGKHLKDLPGSEHFRVGTISPDGRWLAGESRATLRVWDLQTGQPVPGGAGHIGPIGLLAFSPRLDTIATTGDDGGLRLWDPLTGKLKAALLGEGDWVRGLAFAPDGRLLASSDFSDAVRIWDVAAGKQLHQVAGHGKIGGYRAVGFSADGATLTSWGDDYYLRRWQMKTGKALSEARTRPEGLMVPPEDDDGERFSEEHIVFTAGAAVVPGAEQFALLGRDGRLHLFAAATGKALRVLKTDLRDPNALALSPSGKQFATFDTAGNVVIGDLASGRALFTVPSDGSAGQVAFSADGRTVVRATASGVALVEVATGKVRFTLSPASPWIPYCTLSPDGRLLVTAMPDTTALVWDLAVLARGKADS
jgi:WD40 repeat protein